MKFFFRIILAVVLSLSLSATVHQPAIAGSKNLNRIIGIGAGVILLNEARKRSKRSRRSRSRSRSRSRAKSRKRGRSRVRQQARRSTSRQNSATRQRGIAIQKSLNALGYDVGKVDGVVGSGTRSQISSWQYSAGLAATGVLTANQFNQLTNEAGVNTSHLATEAAAYQAGGAAPELTRDEIRTMQRSLNILGYKAGSVDGKLGRGTGRALKRFLLDRGHDPETTSPQAAVALAADLAGLPYSGPKSVETGGGQFAVAKPRSGEVSIFDSAQQSLTSEDFEQNITARVGQSGGGLNSFTTYDVDDGSITRDMSGMLDLVAMMIAANPGILDDQERLAGLYKFEGRTYKSSYRIEETLAAYRNELKQRPVPNVATVALQWGGSIKPNSYDRTTGLFPVDYNALGSRDQHPSRSFLIRTSLLGHDNPLHISLPNLPNVKGIEMTLPQAESFERKILTDKFNFSNTRAYVVFDGVSYDANRNKMKANAKLVAVNLSQKFNAKKLIHTWPVEGADLGNLINEQLTDATDFIDFMGGMSVVQGHILSGRRTDWSRLSASLLLGAKPDVMQEDDMAISMAKSLLLPNEEELLWQGRPPRDNWRVNEFDWRDTAKKVRDAFGDALVKRAVSPPLKIVDIRPTDLGRYNFESNAYPMSFDRDKELKFSFSRDTPADIVAKLGNTFLPNALEIPDEFAQRLDGIMRVKGNRRFYLAIFSDVEKIDSVRRNNRYRLQISPKVTRIALYADPAMTKLVFDFYGKEGSKLTRLQAEKKSVFEAFAIQHASYDSLLLNADRLVNDPELLQRVVKFSDGAKRANELEVDDVIASISAQLETMEVPKELWLSGKLALGKYDTVKNGFSIRSLAFVENRSKTAELNADFKHEITNDLGVVEIARADARELLKRFPKREFSFRMRAKPVSASWSPQYTDDTIINMAYEALELYVLIGDNRTDDRNKSILARLTYGVDKIEEEQASEAATNVELGERPLLTQDLINAVVASQHGEGLSRRSLSWLVAQQWLTENFDIQSLKQGFFESGARAPTKATKTLLHERFKKWRQANPVEMPKKLRISLHNSRSSFAFDGTGVDPKTELDNCHLADYGYWEDLVGQLGLGDLRQFSEKQNEHMHRGSAEKPSVMSPVLLTYARNPLYCTERIGETLAKQFVGVEDSWKPRVQVVFDRLPMPPMTGKYDAFIIDADVAVTGLDVVKNNNDVPHLILRVAFEKATYNSVKKGKKTPVRTITREDTEPKAATSADGGKVNVVGIEIGMSLDEADTVLREHFSEPTVLEPVFEPSLRTPTFHFARMYVSKDRSERVSVYYENDGRDPQVLAVERILDSPNWKIPRKAVFQSALKKYGKPDLQHHNDYSSELIWGEAVGEQIDDSSYSSGTCQISSSPVRIDQWRETGGAVHNIWEFFTSDNSYNAQIGYTPKMDFYLQPEFSRYVEQCGHFLRLEHDSSGLTIMLMDMKEYASSYLKAREILKNSFNNASEKSDESEADVKL